VDKQSFIALVNNYTNTSPKDAAALAAIQKKYPYSQLIHTLVSRSVNDQKINGADKFIQHAAIYAADRSLLKEVLTSSILIRKEVKSAVLKSEENNIRINTSVKIVDEDVENLSPAALRKDLKKNLGTLARLMKQFEKEFPQAIKVELPPLTNAKKPSTKTESETKIVDEVSATEKLESKVPKKKVVTKKTAPKKRSTKKVANKKSKSTPVKKTVKKVVAKKVVKTKSVPSVEKIEQKKTITKTLQKTAANKSIIETSPITDENSEALIASIKTNKQPIAPENKKQKEQIKIIENFIKVQPRLSAKKRSTSEDNIPEEPDLAARSVEFGDSIISETLAEILIQQGKKEKAIEVLKRLIWKFPQKKTYFAAQIEELKK
jgi:tetratricopeptide (TPR) repeat protein